MTVCDEYGLEMLVQHEFQSLLTVFFVSVSGQKPLLEKG